MFWNRHCTQSLVVSCKYWVVPLVSTRGSGYSHVIYYSPVLSLMSQEGYRSSASATKMTEIIISQMTKSNTYIHFFVSKTLSMTCPETNFCPKFFSLADFLNLHFSNLFKRKCHQNPVAQLAGLLVPGHWAMVYNEAYQYQYSDSNRPLSQIP